jgi:purine nucleosidase/pyrimidine-specific ribonucleoside hydrolase
MRSSILFAVLMLAAALSVVAAGRPIPVIFDTDIGGDIDDALALALALQSPELDVRGVTTVSDDTFDRSRLAWKQLGLYGRLDIPLATGAREPLFHRADLRPLGQMKLLTAADTLPEPARRRAAEFLVETLMKSPEKLTLVPVGPLTNIALALKLEPAIRDHIERIVLMGGAFDLLFAEYNIVRDSAAAEIVFASGIPIAAVGLDVTLKCRLERKDIERIHASPHATTRFLGELIEAWRNRRPDRYPVLHDALAVAVTFLPELVEMQQGQVKVEYGSAVTDGITVFRKDAKGTTWVALKVDARKFVELFVDRITAAPRSK